MATAEKKDEKTLNLIADGIALMIADGPDSEKALLATHHWKIVNAGIVQAGQINHPEVAELRKLISNRLKELARKED